MSRGTLPGHACEKRANHRQTSHHENKAEPTLDSLTRFPAFDSKLTSKRPSRNNNTMHGTQRQRLLSSISNPITLHKEKRKNQRRRGEWGKRGKKPAEPSSCFLKREKCNNKTPCILRIWVCLRRFVPTEINFEREGQGNRNRLKIFCKNV